jgi:FkbM family methyltransferase
MTDYNTYNIEGEDLIKEALLREVGFFEKIKYKCEIIFDIGCRDDIDYINISKGKVFHLFEPNPIFFMECKKKINKIFDNVVILNNFGISNKTGIFDYWEAYQSFFRRSYLVPDTEFSSISLLLKKFSEYIEENKINKIDFLKIDTEGSEPDILLDFPYFIKNNIKYIQFEYASTWIDRNDGKSFYDIYNFYKKYFYFYILYNKRHPISVNFLVSENSTASVLIKIDNNELISKMKFYMEEGSGFEIIMINKKENDI